MWIELILVVVLSVNVVLLACIPHLVRKAVKEELKRLFEGEPQ